MQNMSQKRERLEKRLRSQLEAEIREIRGGKGAGQEEEGPGTEDCQLKSRIATLEADVAKVGYSKCLSLLCICSPRKGHLLMFTCYSSAQWEHKCLELAAERQMALEAAVIPR